MQNWTGSWQLHVAGNCLGNEWKSTIVIQHQQCQTLVIAPGQRVENDKHVIMRNSGLDEPFGGDPVASPADIPERDETFCRMDRIMVLLFRVVPGSAQSMSPSTSMAPTSDNIVDRHRALALFEGKDQYYRRLMALLGTAAEASDENGNPIYWDKHQISIQPQLDGIVMDGTNYDPNVIWQAGEEIYMWHCHILSHEDHEMMRVIQVLLDARCKEWKMRRRQRKIKQLDVR